MRALLAGLIMALLLGPTAAYPQTGRNYSADETFLEGDRQLLCDLIGTYPAISRLGFAEFVEEFPEESRLDDIARTLVWKIAPNHVSCGGKAFELKGEPYGNRLDSVGISADGQWAAFAGGYLYGPMHGGGGECIFRRVPDGWKLEGCFRTWDV